MSKTVTDQMVHTTPKDDHVREVEITLNALATGDTWTPERAEAPDRTPQEAITGDLRLRDRQSPPDEIGSVTTLLQSR